LETQQPGVEDARQSAGGVGFSDARVALEQDGAFERDRACERRREPSSAT